MGNAIVYGAIFIGIISSFNIFEIIFYSFFGIKNKKIWKWMTFLACSVLLFNQPNTFSFAILLFGFLLFTMGKMIYLIQSLKSTNS